MYMSKLVIEVAENERYILREPLFYEDDKWSIVVREYFEYNGGSVPSILHWVQCPMEYTMAYGSLIHDALYASKLLSRKDADKILFHSLVHKGMNPAKALLVYKAVRIGGQEYYDNYIGVSNARDYVLVEPNVNV